MFSAQDVISGYGARRPHETCAESASGIIAALDAVGMVICSRDVLQEKDLKIEELIIEKYDYMRAATNA